MIEEVKRRMPQDYLMKLNCAYYGPDCFHYAYQPLRELVKVVCEVMHERNYHKPLDYYEFVDVINEITGLCFCYDDGDDDWDDGDEKLQNWFDEETYFM